MFARFTILPAGVLASGLLIAGPCTPAGPSAEPSGGPSTSSGVRFALRVGAGAARPVYVQVKEVDNQPGWVVVTRQGERVFLGERCEIEDCGGAPAVCGAAIPLVRDVAATGAAREIEYRWDGVMSTVNPATRCETRAPAPSGAYVARFCYARQADLAEGGGAAGGDQQGQVVAPTCRDVPFSLPSQGDVVFEVPAG